MADDNIKNEYPVPGNGNVLFPDNVDSGYLNSSGLDSLKDVTEGDIYTKINELQTVLNGLVSLISNTDVETSNPQRNHIEELLNTLDTKTLQSVISVIKKDNDIEETETTGFNTIPNKFYHIGETCLLLDPFDNYRIFTLFKDEDKKIPLDISDGQMLYIVFKQGNKEIRIQEYPPSGISIILNRTCGQVLFKIDKKHALEIMNMRNRTFYITRVYETYDPVSDSIVQSDEEVVFSGYWGDRNSERESQLYERIENLQNLVAQKEAALQAMMDSIKELVNTQLERDNEIEKLKGDLQKSEDDYNSLKEEYDKLYNYLKETHPDELNDFENKEMNSGKIIDSKTLLVSYDKLPAGFQSGIDEAVEKGFAKNQNNQSNYNLENDLEDFTLR